MATLALLLVATLAAYAPAWNGGVLWDDDAHITAPELRSTEGLRRIWFEIGATQQYYPVVHSAFWVMHRAWGDRTLGYHLANIVLHATSAFLLVLILNRLGVPGARLAGMLFALHPVHAESVAWITELKNTLSGLFCLAAALVYLRYDEATHNASPGLRMTPARGAVRRTTAVLAETGQAKGRQRLLYCASLAFFLFALLSKSVTATLPAALLVVLWWKRGRISWHGDVRPLLPFFVFAVAAGAMTIWVERTYIGATGAGFELTWLERALLAARATVFYVSKLAWPTDLMFVYPRWTISATDPVLHVCVGVVVGTLAALWRLRHRWRGPLAVALLYGGMLFPALGFFNVYPFRFSFVADHFQYLASAAPLAFAAAGIVLLLQRFWPPRRELIVSCAFAGALGLLTWHQSKQYVSAEMLYRSTLARNPECWLCHNNLAVLKIEASDDQLAEGLAHLEQSLAITRRNEVAFNNRGVILRRMGRNGEAIRDLEEAVRLSPNYADARWNLGLALEEAGRFEDALVHYDHLASLRSRAAQGHLHAGGALLALGRHDEAIARLDAALRLGPDLVSARGKLGIALARRGRHTEAIDHFRAVVRAMPDDGDAHGNLASALLAAGRYDEAIHEYREALRLAAGAARTHDNLGYALLRKGDRHEAAMHFEEALRLDPDYAPAHVNAANLLVDAGRPTEAIVHYERALASGQQIDSAQVHSNLGVAYAMTGRTGLAIQHFREALRIRPDFTQAQSNLERALRRRR